MSDAPTTFDAVAWPVTTDRLSIRPATPDDVEATWAFRRRDDVGQWMSHGPATLDVYRERFLRPHRLATTLVVERDGDVIGDLMLRVEDAWAQAEVLGDAAGVQAELGWAFHPDHGGRGHATEAVRALLRIAFDDLGLRRVTATCFADNEASWRLMERVGMRREVHAVREALHRSHGWVDAYGYALLADEHADVGRRG
ncbi:GNAT family N-acetyltransferase [Nocardioides sp.]|uniref:GNAT family N-acetyltransferase n=1 Tax=Nocardioides sp. TaxID=35761 RepID=UPI0035B384F7